MKPFNFLIAFGAVLIISCGESTPNMHDVDTNDSATSTQPSSTAPDSVMPNRNPASVVEPSNETAPVKGSVVAYCPSSMIEDEASILSVAISKNDLQEVKDFVTSKVLADDQTAKPEKVGEDLKSDSILVYKKMKVSLSLDNDIFSYSALTDTVQYFESAINSLVWEWQVKPKKVSEKTFVLFKFYGVEQNGNVDSLVKTKTIVVKVQVNARGTIGKLLDFLSNDPKTTLTAILIPLFSFLGGLLVGKKGKQKPDK
jgi:hypothetical protein